MVDWPQPAYPTLNPAPAQLYFTISGTPPSTKRRITQTRTVNETGYGTEKRGRGFGWPHTPNIWETRKEAGRLFSCHNTQLRVCVKCVVIPASRFHPCWAGMASLPRVSSLYVFQTLKSVCFSSFAVNLNDVIPFVAHVSLCNACLNLPS